MFQKLKFLKDARNSGRNIEEVQNVINPFHQFDDTPESGRQFRKSRLPFGRYAENRLTKKRREFKIPKLPSWLILAARRMRVEFRDYFERSSIHGLRYIADPGRHWIERLFWFLVCSASFYGTYVLLMASWFAFQNNAVSFVTETAYLDWNTTFPAVSVCETESPDKLYDSAARVFGKDRNRNLDFFLRDIVFFDGTCRSCSTQCGILMKCPEDLEDMIEKVRAPCNKLLGFCKWNGVPFDCCKNFLPLPTETGLCYTINSIQNHEYPNGTLVYKDRLKLYSNHMTGPGVLEFLVLESIKVFIHAPEDVPYFNHPQDEKDALFWGLLFNMRFQVTEIENDPRLPEVSVVQRNCRFPDENPLKLHRKYSYSACVVECHARYQIEFCNCTHHYMPNMRGFPVQKCGVEGLKCLNSHSEELRSLKTEWNSKPGLVCDCVSSCNEPEFNVIWKNSQANEEREGEQFGTKVQLVLDQLPTNRFKRNVVRTRLDLVVSMGGTAGLFLGASLLTFVELFYYCLRKKPPLSSFRTPPPTAESKNTIISTVSQKAY